MIAKSSTTRTPNPGNAQPIRAPRAPGAGAGDAADPGESMACIAACSSVAGLAGAPVLSGPLFLPPPPRGVRRGATPRDKLLASGALSRRHHSSARAVARGL